MEFLDKLILIIQDHIVFLVLGGIILFLVFGAIDAVNNAPEGYEDEEGYHEGKDEHL